MFKKSTTLFFLFLLLSGCLEAAAYSEKEYLQLAQAAYENDFYDVSLSFLNRLTKEYPESPYLPYAVILKGLNLRKSGHISEAQECFSQVIDRYPESGYVGQAYYLRAEGHLTNGRYLAAADDFRRALSSFNLPAEMVSSAYEGLLTSQVAAGQFFESLATLTEWEAADPAAAQRIENQKKISDAAVIAAANSLKDKNYAQVHTIVRFFEQRFPESPEGLINRLRYYQAWAFWEEKNIPAAQTLFLELFKSGDAEIKAASAYQLGDISFTQKDYETATTYYQQAARLSTDVEIKASALFQLGIIALRRQSYQNAVSFFQQGLALSTGVDWRRRFLAELADTFFLAGEYQSAINQYRILRQEFPQDSEQDRFLLQEAFALYNLKRYPEALQTFTEFNRLFVSSPLSGRACYGLGLTYVALGKKKEAAVVWEEYLVRQAVVVNDAPMVLLLARLYLEDGRGAEAVPYLKRLTTSPQAAVETKAEAHLLTGIAYLQQNEVNLALKEFDAGLSLQPPTELADSLKKNKADLLLAKQDYVAALPLYQSLRDRLPERKGEILFGLGRSLHGLGRDDEAVEVYLEALINLPPDSILTKEIKTDLSEIKKRRR